MYRSNIILQIQSTYNQLTKAEKKVADYVLLNQNEVLYMSITDLADACKVGDTGVYRFCRTLNLQGYQEFKMRLSLGISEQPLKKNFSGEDDDDESLAYKVMEQHMSFAGILYAVGS